MEREVSHHVSMPLRHRVFSLVDYWPDTFKPLPNPGKSRRWLDGEGFCKNARRFKYENRRVDSPSNETPYTKTSIGPPNNENNELKPIATQDGPPRLGQRIYSVLLR